MSSHSYNGTCPVCGNEDMNINSENRPFDSTTIYCSNCGLYSTVNVGRASLEDLLEETKETLEQDGIAEKEIQEKLKQISDNYDSYTENYNRIL